MKAKSILKIKLYVLLQIIHKLREIESVGNSKPNFSVFIDFMQLLSTDFEIGHFLRARVIPKAALYYTGDIVEEDDDDDYDEGMIHFNNLYIIESSRVY